MKNLQDERIFSQKIKIQSDAYKILVYCLLISVVIQQFILREPFPQFAVEFFCLMGIGIYMTIRHLTAGIWNVTEHTIKKILFNSVTSGIITVLLFAVLAGENDIFNLVIFFLSFTSINLIVNLTFWHINKKKLKQIDNQLNDEESNE